MQHPTIAVDLAKNVFEIAVSRRVGKVHERKRLPRSQFLSFFADREASLVLLEACGSAHYWARKLESLGHRVVLLPPHEVRPYVTRNKTDRSDAKALLEAARNEKIRPVPVKSIDQQALCALHRLRSGWLSTRTARINCVRGLLREFGFVIPLGAKQVVSRAREIIRDDTSTPAPLSTLLEEACSEIEELEERVRSAEREIAALARQEPIVQRLRTIPGIGLLTATALFAMVGGVKRFRSSRHFASYLGLTPREHSTGNRRRLGSISKQGDVYLRMLLTHGARSVLCAAARARDRNDRLKDWGRRLQGTRGHNKAAIAVANKLARIVWAVWQREKDFESVPAA